MPLHPLVGEVSPCRGALLSIFMFFFIFLLLGGITGSNPVAADLDTKARWELAHERVLVDKYAKATSAAFEVISRSSVFYIFFFK